MSEVKQSGRRPEDQLWTPPYDGRFHSQNNTKYCWQNLVDLIRCIEVKGKAEEGVNWPCEYFARSYIALCPSHMREKFEEQIAEGAFPIRGMKPK